MDLSDRPCFSVSIRHGKSHCDNSKIAIVTKSEISTAEDDIYEMSDCVSLHKRHQRLRAEIGNEMSIRLFTSTETYIQTTTSNRNTTSAE